MTTAFSETIEVRRLTTATKIAECQRLRYKIWSAEGVEIINPEAGTIADSHDDHAMHWGVFDGARLVAAARLCLHQTLAEAPDGELFAGLEIPTPIASMNRLVVTKSHRGRGIAKNLDQIRIQQARVLEAQTVIIAPVNFWSRKRSLEAQGFSVCSERLGRPVWSPTVEICPCYLTLISKEHTRR
jgi:GNAT superfamily N-acetyltransferase